MEDHPINPSNYPSIHSNNSKKSSEVAAVAIGSNIGDRISTIIKAINKIENLPETRVIRTSHAYSTPPAFYEEQPPFINAAILIQTSLPPQHLLAALLDIERSLGRIRSIQNGPRTIDLDLLTYGSLVFSFEAGELPALTLPHPGLASRDFVLIPLQEIAPDMEHPVLHKTTTQLLEALPSIQAERLETIPWQLIP